MTEAEWQASNNLEEMLEFAGDQASERKLRLFACACCRRIWHHLPDERSRQVVRVAERFADGLATKQELAVARNVARNDDSDSTEFPIGDVAKQSARNAARNIARNAARLAAAEDAASAAWDTAGAVSWYVATIAAERKAVRETVLAAEQLAQAGLLREMIHPFLKGMLTEPWPPAVRAPAQALYEGGGDGSALCAALLAAGQNELAKHFQAPGHPKGCWALDFILRRE